MKFFVPFRTGDRVVWFGRRGRIVEWERMSDHWPRPRGMPPGHPRAWVCLDDLRHMEPRIVVESVAQRLDARLIDIAELSHLSVVDTLAELT